MHQDLREETPPIGFRDLELMAGYHIDFTVRIVGDLPLLAQFRRRMRDGPGVFQPHSLLDDGRWVKSTTVTE